MPLHEFYEPKLVRFRELNERPIGNRNMAKTLAAHPRNLKIRCSSQATIATGR